MEVLEQNSFSNQKQIELLHVINYALHKKHYPQDTCGIIERKIKLLEQSEQEAVPISSNLQLSNKKGFKVNFIRVINCLFELSFFTDKMGGYITKKEVFDILGKTINQDLSTYQNLLSVTKAAAKSDMKSTLSIFEQMYAKQQEINNR
jgi:D-alanyl-lipoteichoic acid acyltransferase DltB (MBOAT superfamily)